MDETIRKASLQCEASNFEYARDLLKSAQFQISELAKY